MSRNTKSDDYNNTNHTFNHEGKHNGEHQTHSNGGNTSGTNATTTNNKNDNYSFVQIARSKLYTADSIANFEESEWTPPDSSYGAACPVCGFIPKRVQQMIKMTLIAAMVFFLIYLVVTTLMKIADAHRG